MSQSNAFAIHVSGVSFLLPGLRMGELADPNVTDNLRQVRDAMGSKLRGMQKQSEGGPNGS